ESARKGARRSTLAPPASVLRSRFAPGPKALTKHPERRRRQVVRQRSAKPPSPVQIRAAPPITTSVNAVTYRYGVRELIRRFGNTWEQLAFYCFDRLPVRGIDDVRVDVERRLNARMTEL